MDTSTRFSTFGTDEKDLKWIRIIEEWRDSGQSIAEWIREHDEFTYDQFHHYRRKLFPDELRKRDNSNKKESIEQETFERETTWSALSMELPTSSIDVFVNRYRVVVKAGFDQELLREVVEVLKDAN
ncbi:hypothetical protein M3196_21645 [Fictibacillus nanhaiensis]|uniref:IS66 family insertion sequence element accessory protein TnpA n=1 Tax=Fictibacillus nanhaiensis TaxID=742169 RepID=UPI00203B4A5C|nr:hypothetical protein [Fictibacillus nanhaiensis]MCM3734232.1 hypothetical protein [Fictibacillus nanhaiensis]